MAEEVLLQKAVLDEAPLIQALLQFLEGLPGGGEGLLTFLARLAAEKCVLLPDGVSVTALGLRQVAMETPWSQEDLLRVDASCYERLRSLLLVDTQEYPLSLLEERQLLGARDFSTQARRCDTVHRSPGPDVSKASFQETVVEVSESSEGGRGSLAEEGLLGASELDSPIPGFEILGELGRGGMAVVYKARQINLDRIVALKVMDPALASHPDFITRFEREARAMASLSHSNVVAIHDRGQYQGRFYIVMEYVEGYSLRSVLEEVGGKLPVDWVLRVMLQVAVALSFAHGEGMVHRDIKPENILIDEEGVAKLSDFGLAVLNEEGSPKLTQTNTAMGTYHYMAPEQQTDAARADARADIYSFGVMLYEVITGSVPLGAWQPVAALVPDIDPRFDDLITRCLQPDRDRRPASIEEVLVALRSFQLGLEEVPQLENAVGEDSPAFPKAPPGDQAEVFLDHAHDHGDDLVKRLKEEHDREERAREELRRKQAEEDRDIGSGLYHIWTKRWKDLLEMMGISSRAATVGICAGVFLLLGGFQLLLPGPPLDKPVKAQKQGDTFAYFKDGKLRHLTEEQLHEEFRKEPVYEVDAPPEELYSEDVLADTTSVLRVEPTTAELEAAGVTRLTTETLVALSAEINPKDSKEVMQALKSKDSRMVMAALDLQRQGKIHYKAGFLKRVHEHSGDPRVKRLIVDMLVVQKDNKAAQKTLVGMISPEGPSSGYILAQMRQAELPVELSTQVKQGFLLKAALAREASATSLEAIRTIAAIEGSESEQLLLKLRSDRSAALSRMATAAWDFRVRLGLIPGKQALPRPPPEPPSDLDNPF
jgi:serine/threonine protein kinase